MKYSIAILAVAAAVHASPVPVPQAVTAMISPDTPAPSGCMPNYSGSFGIVAMNVTAAASGAPVSEGSDGQPGAPTAAPVSTIADGQPQAPTAAPVTTIADGQPQAPTPSVMMPKPISQISDGQPQAGTGAVSQISDGQIQAPTMMPAVSQISDGQIQAPTMMPAVSQISDGQIQAPAPTAAPVSQISDGQPQAPAPTAAPVSEISDGQPQAPATTAAAVSEISDGQPQVPTATVPAASQISDGQPQAPAATESSDGQPEAPMATMSSSMAACAGPDVLTIMLADGVLTDDQGRTGYIAANYQFQFDGPPQAGAIYTSGWTVCGNGSLALGGQTTFYQCLSGDFYNLYSENWAPQCNAVTIDVLSLMDCASS